MTIPTKNLLEWAVFGLSTILILAVIAVLGMEVFATGDAPPQLRVETGTSIPGEQELLLPVSITNIGDRVAEQVQLSFTVVRANSGQEEFTLTIDLLPRMMSQEYLLQLHPDGGTVERVEWRIGGFQSS
jgi:uncharacterized protein (TIGR02588 family)